MIKIQYNCTTESINFKPTAKEVFSSGRRWFSKRMFIAVLVVIPLTWISHLLLLIAKIVKEETEQIAKSLLICFALFFMYIIPLIVFLVNYNKVFKRKTYIYLLICFIMCSIMWATLLLAFCTCFLGCCAAIFANEAEEKQ